MTKPNHPRHDILNEFVAGVLPGAQEAECLEHCSTCTACSAILHDLIRAEEIVDRYHLKELSPKQEEFFEKHFLGCDACFQEVKKIQELAMAMEAAVRLGEIERLTPDPPLGRQKAPSSPAIFVHLWQLFQKPAFGLATAGLLLVSLYPAYIGFVQLAQILTTDQQMQASLLRARTYALELDRSRDAHVQQKDELVISLSAEHNDAFVFTFNILEETKPYSIYRAEIRNERNELIGEIENLEWSGDFKVFNIVCQGVFFRAGKYRLIVQEFNSVESIARDKLIQPFAVTRRD